VYRNKTTKNNKSNGTFGFSFNSPPYAKKIVPDKQQNSGSYAPEYIT
jgi:hypothetical protein